MWWLAALAALAAGGGATAARAQGRSDRPTWNSDGQGTSVVAGEWGQGAANTSCRTPEPWGQPGHCISLNNCKELLDLLRASRLNPKGRPDENVTQLLRKSHCGFLGGVPRVCCADGPPSPPSNEQWAAAGGAGTDYAGGYDPPSGGGASRPAIPEATDRFHPGKQPAPQLPEEMSLPLDEYPARPAPAAMPAPPANRPGDHHSSSRESAPNTPRVPPPTAQSAHNQPMPKPVMESAGGPPRMPGGDADPGYPAENLALLPTEVCGMRFHPRPAERAEREEQAGNRSGLMQYPWMARLGYRLSDRGDADRLEYLCSGSLISERYVLTAAHCLVVHKGPASVRLGELDTHSDPDCVGSACAAAVEDIGVDEVLVHPEYMRGLNDIGLLRLARPAAFSESVNPVCLPIPAQGRPEEDLAGRTMTVASWGNTSPNRREHAPSQWLLHRRGQVLGPARCTSLYGSLDDVRFDPSMQLCVGGGCQGDSGSPLVLAEDAGDQAAPWSMQQRAILYGVLSYGQLDCALRSAPLVFTKVSRYVPWVVQNLKPNPFVSKEPAVSSSARLVDPRLTRPGRPRARTSH